MLTSSMVLMAHVDACAIMPMYMTIPICSGPNLVNRLITLGIDERNLNEHQSHRGPDICEDDHVHWEML